MKTGDCIAFSGSGLFSRAIQWVTKSPYSHVGLVVRLPQGGEHEVFLLHAILGQGVVLLPLSRSLGQHQGMAWWAQMDHTLAATINPTYQADLTRYAMAQLGRSYDLKGVLQFVVPWVKASATANFCSEMAAESFKAAKLMSETFVSPAQFLRHGIFLPTVSLA